MPQAARSELAQDDGGARESLRLRAQLCRQS